MRTLPRSTTACASRREAPRCGRGARLRPCGARTSAGTAQPKASRSCCGLVAACASRLSWVHDDARSTPSSPGQPLLRRVSSSSPRATQGPRDLRGHWSLTLLAPTGGCMKSRRAIGVCCMRARPRVHPGDGTHGAPLPSPDAVRYALGGVAPGSARPRPGNSLALIPRRSHLALKPGARRSVPRGVAQARAEGPLS